MHDELGKRMKEQYEHRTRYMLPRRTYTIIRIDGKAFHTFTRHAQRPFDKTIMDLMDVTTLRLCENIQGVKFAYTQSDEISLLLTDFETIKTNAWFDSNLQKVCSISASVATEAFNRYYLKMQIGDFLKNEGSLNDSDAQVAFSELMSILPLAHFDSRVFTIPDPIEVSNYFVWRQQDATRNSIQMAAQSLYSHKQLHGKNVNELQEMIFQKGINWNDYSVREKRGRTVIKDENGWRYDDPPVFTQDRQYLMSRIPVIKVGE